MKSGLEAIAGLKVMVIDDSNTIRRSAEIFLKQAKCEVILAEDGFDALAKLGDCRPGLVVCDVVMPRCCSLQGFTRWMICPNFDQKRSMTASPNSSVRTQVFVTVAAVV